MLVQHQVCGFNYTMEDMVVRSLLMLISTAEPYLPEYCKDTSHDVLVHIEKAMLFRQNKASYVNH